MAGYKTPSIDKFMKKKIMGTKSPMTSELDKKSPSGVRQIPDVRPTSMRNLAPVKKGK